MTMAKSYGKNNYLGMTCLDRNGFVHVFVDKGLPTMGTYYVFKPSAKGKLTVKGVFHQNGSGTADAHIYEGTNQKELYLTKPITPEPQIHLNSRPARHIIYMCQQTLMLRIMTSSV